MPVILLVGPTSEYANQMALAFQDTFSPIILKGHFQSIRSSLANPSPNSLYIIPGLDKPDRYEIFCLARKSNSNFITIATTSREGLASSDKNCLLLDEFDFEKISKTLASSKTERNTAHKRTKGISLDGLSSLKSAISEANKELATNNSNLSGTFKECEESIVQMYKKGISTSVTELTKTYKEMVLDKAKKY